MPLVLGLGNPGPRYEGTRHNVGFDVVTALSDRLHLSFRKPFFSSYEWSGRGEFVLCRPLTFMNRSGDIVSHLLRAARMDESQLIVICDNLDLEPGVVRLKRRGSRGSHNGVASVHDAIGHGEFPRIYLGIGRPHNGEAVVDYVLARPPEEESQRYSQAVAAAVEAVLALPVDGIDAVMNRLNRRQ